MEHILTLLLGATAGAALTVVLFALLNMSKQCDMDDEKAEIYKEGYQKGFDDGYELKQSHLK